MNSPYLYLLIRNDLNSLNPGKAVAHGAHAANQFVHEWGWTPTRTPAPGIEEWQNSTPLGFGVTITLHVDLKQLQAVVRIGDIMGFPAGATVDPSYPYVIAREYADLIAHPEEFPPVDIGNGKVLCHREEITAGYIFGDKDQLKPIIGHFPLMP